MTAFTGRHYVAPFIETLYPHKESGNLKQLILILVSLFCLSACGTMRTLGDEPIPISSPKYSGSQPCKTINRVYSGVQYDYCVVNKGDGSDWELKGYLVWDFPFSFVLDTVALPYTLYKQITVGSLVQSYPNEAGAN